MAERCVRPGCSPAPHRQRTRPGPHSRPKPRNLISSSAGTEVLMASFSCLTCSPEILNKAVPGMHSGLSFMLVWAQDTRKQMFPVHPAERKPWMMSTSRLQSHWLRCKGLVVSGCVGDKNVFLRTVQWHRGRFKSAYFQNEGKPRRCQPGASSMKGHRGKAQAERDEAVYGMRGKLILFFVFALKLGSPTQDLEPLGTEPCPQPKFKSLFYELRKFLRPSSEISIVAIVYFNYKISTWCLKNNFYLFKLFTWWDIILMFSFHFDIVSFNCLNSSVIAILLFE